jgi:hypothetical protein
VEPLGDLGRARLLRVGDGLLGFRESLGLELVEILLEGLRAVFGFAPRTSLFLEGSLASVAELLIVACRR